MRSRRNDVGYVIFLDSDDLLRPGAAAAVAKVWRPGLAKAQFGL